eukprot:TRINITY_DN62609_c0_g1_i1.p2 TRINITY_DN62609_c0_g1~~TRINITY_DN62609_c0_g1_i1.p2  ORF type:complete len:108 (-),score=4.02 TRINITY_DN62609_c0_g1_i1:328-651(-)
MSQLHKMFSTGTETFVAWPTAGQGAQCKGVRVDKIRGECSSRFGMLRIISACMHQQYLIVAGVYNEQPKAASFSIWKLGSLVRCGAAQSTPFLVFRWLVGGSAPWGE